MDIVSHGLWGGVAFGRKSRKDYLLAFLFGIMPDMFSFGILFTTNLLGITIGPKYSNGRPDFASIPEYVSQLYDVTHSLVVFALVFAIVWYWRKKPFWPLAAWGLHILVDIPTHSLEFFATPFLWPFSDYKFDGINWGNPWIFFPNVTLLTVAYLTWMIARLKKRKGK
ncbi:MAG TPA: hypothetical protein DCX32_04875 [Candidatus Moranbacteria bacterium]|nr:MAG: hypothetical protein UW95_C0012G0002 [Parcubacteria group bacterium GW2011_GWC1_45_14]HAV11840.1 hypothetical protein [Candidatus Moranbacteria bacterium]